MTLLAFLSGGLFGWLHFETIGRTVAFGVTVWIGWYGLVLAALVFEAWRSRLPGPRAASLVMLASFIAAHVIWNASLWPIAAHSLKNIVVATMLIGIAAAYSNRTVLVAAFIHLAIVAVGFGADFGVLFEGRRPMQFIAWSFPDASAGPQHAALLVLALGTREREDVALGLHSRSGDHRGAYGLATVAVREGESKAP